MAINAQGYNGEKLTLDKLPSEVQEKAISSAINFELESARKYKEEATKAVMTNLNSAINRAVIKKASSAYLLYRKMFLNKDFAKKIITGNLSEFTPDGEYIYYMR